MNFSLKIEFDASHERSVLQFAILIACTLEQISREEAVSITRLMLVTWELGHTNGAIATARKSRHGETSLWLHVAELRISLGSVVFSCVSDEVLRND